MGSNASTSENVLHSTEEEALIKEQATSKEHKNAITKSYMTC